MNTKTVQHSGDFVLTRKGTIDFGEIPPAVASIIKRQPGKIRLRIGVQLENEKGNYGEKHIERPERMEALNKCGYDNARDFIEDVCSDYDVQTGYPSRKSGKNKKPLLWKRQ